MKSLLLSHSDHIGGAFRAAYRLHRALLQHDIDSRMKVRRKESDDWTVEGPQGKFGKVWGMLREPLASLPMRLQRTANMNPHSGNWLPSTYAQQINASDADVINLHWVGGETLSIEDIGHIKKPVVWTLHDMWPFCGAEHLAPDDTAARWRGGYTVTNRSSVDRGPDLDRYVWLRKRRAWKRPMHTIAPSRWLANCAHSSELMLDWPVTVIPNVIDTDTYQPLDRGFCRQALGLPQDKQIVLFGAKGGGKDPNKGYDLLINALGRLRTQIHPERLLCVVFGQSEPQKLPALVFPTRWMGHVYDDFTLVLLYNAADVMVVPSRQENLPQTATESQACGCPVVAFDCTGFPDAVVHRATGYLARAYEVEDMAKGLHWILADPQRRDILGQAAHKRALQLWQPEVVVRQYCDVFQQAIESNQ